jgi:predicted aldo/keto reductase-like oxidoreductase
MFAKKLGFGFMRLPLTDPKDQKSIDREQVRQMVDLFIERGFRYFDSAYVYHDEISEIVLRETLVKRYPRDGFTIATKMPLFMLRSKDQQRAIFNEQLEKCGVEFFDYYLLHDINRMSYPIAKQLDSFAFIAEQKKAEKIRNAGFSFHENADLLDEVLTEHPEVDFVQLQINYLDWDNASIQSGKCYETAVKHGKKVIVMEPVKGGTLANVSKEAEILFRRHQPDLSAASWAIRFAASLENVMVVLSGMSNVEQVTDNTGYMHGFTPLTAQEQDTVKQAVKIIYSSIAIPCTSCRYCAPGCLKNIAIPEYFALYNAQQHDVNRNNFSPQLDYFASLVQSHGKPSDCIQCKKCEEICPQHLRITEHLKDVAAEFEGGLAMMAEIMTGESIA